MCIKQSIKGTIVILVMILFLLPMAIYAHGGGTDENGGHYDHSTGEYHYHHGFPAHQHGEDGSCPYEGEEPYYDDNDVDVDSEDDDITRESPIKSASRTESIIELLFGAIGGVIAVLFFVLLGIIMEPSSQLVPSVTGKTYYCPYCGAPMVLRESRYGQFYGCSNYPACHGIRDINGRAKKRRKRRI